MLRSGLDKHTMRLSHNRFTKSDNFSETARMRENFGMSCYPDDPAQNLWRNAIARVAVNDAIQPTSAKIVVAGIRPEGVHKNVYVRKNHRSAMRSSRSLDRLRSTPGSVPPEALEIGNRTRLRRTGLDSASTVFKPSSTSEVKVRPCSAAFFLARRSRSPESRIVVLICQGIYARHQYVKPVFRCPWCGRNIVAVSGRRIRSSTIYPPTPTSICIPISGSVQFRRQGKELGTIKPGYIIGVAYALAGDPSSVEATFTARATYPGL